MGVTARSAFAPDSPAGLSPEAAVRFRPSATAQPGAPGLATPAAPGPHTTRADGEWAGDTTRLPEDGSHDLPAAALALSLPAVLHALSDPVRLQIVAQLADGTERTCSSLEVPVAKSTSSHHFRVLRESGVLAQRAHGKCRLNRLRVEELERSFPGLIDAVLRATGG